MNALEPLVPAPAAARARSLGRLPIGFTKRSILAFLLGLLWLVPAWWDPRLITAMFLWDALILLAWVFDFAKLPVPSELLARRIWEKPPSLAVAGRIVLELQNLGKQGIHVDAVDETPLTLRDRPPLLEFSVPPNAHSRAQYLILPRERGDLRLGRLFLRYRTFLGLAERRAAAEISQTIRVLPDLEQARQHALFLIRSRQVEMERRRKRHRGTGREFESLRDYREGDDVRDVCWTATARRRQLITRIFQIERSQAVWIVLDAGRLLRARVQEEHKTIRLSKLDFAVNAALSLAHVANQCGDRVGLVAYGRAIQQNVGPGRGPLHLRTLVDRLAQVHGESSEADHARAAHTLLAGQNRRSLIVWITDFSETAATPEVIEYSMQMALRHLLVFAAMSQPDLNALAQKVPQSTAEMYRHAAALEIVQRRELLLRGLRQRGVLAFELVPGLLASTLINQYLDIKERSLL
jgi:uncharacterized protein (DUF58 family)